MSDSETLSPDTEDKQIKKIDNSNANSDFPNMFVDLIKKVNVKVSIFLFILGIFIFSDIFIENFLPSSYQDGTNCPNSSGTVVQLVILVLAYIIIDLLCQGGIL